MAYKISFDRKSAKYLKKLPKDEARRIIQVIEKLSDNPRPQGCKKLEGRPAWRIRVGNYRVLYSIKDDQLLILVVNIGHRREIYR